MNKISKIFRQIKNNQAGMGLSMKIALGFAGAVVLAMLVGVIVFFVKS